MTLPNTPLPFIIGPIPVELAQIGTTIPPLPNTGRTSYASGLKAGFLFGDAFFWNNTLTQNAYYSTWGMQGYRIKANGENCMYMDFGRLAAGGLQFNPYSPNLFQIGPATFIMTGSGGGPLIQYQMPDQFNNGSTISVAASNVDIPAPCGEGSLHSTFYATAQNLVGYEFVQSFEVNSNIYAAIYAMLPTGQQLINSGFIANVAPGQSAFDLTSQSLPPSISATYNTGTAEGNLAFQGGNSFYFSNGESVPYYLGGTGLQIVQGGPALNCTDVGNSQTYVTTANAFNWSSDQLTTIQAWNNSVSYGSNAYNGWISENPNIFAMSINNGNSLMVFNQGFIGIFSLSANVRTGVLRRDGTIIALGGGGVAGNQGFPIYQAQLPLAQYGLVEPNQVIVQGAVCLTDYARPISTTGRFKT
jgi:hypothetical protein